MVPMMTSSTGNRNSTAAFTLIEILVSVSILAVGLVAIMGAFDTCLSALAASGDRMRATLLMKEQLATIEMSGYGNGASGQFVGDDANFSWRVDVHPVSRPSGVELNEVVVSVWRANGRAAYSLTTCAREPSLR